MWKWSKELKAQILKDMCQSLITIDHGLKLSTYTNYRGKISKHIKYIIPNDHAC